MKNPPDFASWTRAGFILTAASIFYSPSSAQTLPTGITTVPFYDTSKAGLSFFKDKLSTSAMQEVPGKPRHFLVLGYFGYLWTLYPDTTKPDTAMPYGSIKRYTRAQVANWSRTVLKGWEQGSLGFAFDPNFPQNRRLYVIYEKYSDTTQYAPAPGGQTARNGIDNVNNANHVTVIDRYVMSADYNSVARDTAILVMPHGAGYGAGNIMFGKDGYLYIVTSNYNRNSWDSTDYMRKIMRIDVSRQDPGKLYAIPADNPWYNASNPNVKKETWAYGIRNSWSMGMDYITGSFWNAEVGENEWEEINLIQKGKNYGWADGGGQSSTTTDGQGIQGPCSANTTTGVAFKGSYQNPYSYNGSFSFGRTMTCADFTNGTWNFRHTGTAVTTPAAIATSLPGTQMNCIAVSSAFRGSPASPFYGYHFITDVQRNYFLAVKEGVATPQNVGQLATGGPITVNNPSGHDGIVNFPEDGFGNMYVVLLSSSSSGGSTNWHDIYRMSHAQLTANPTSIWTSRHSVDGQGRLFHSTTGGSRLKIPDAYSGVEIYNLAGRKVWSYHGEKRDVLVPGDLEKGILQVRFLP